MTTQNQNTQTKKLAHEQLECLPKVNFMGSNHIQLAHFQHFWCPTIDLKNIIFSQQRFQARDTDLIIASQPKTGTTWLNSLLFAIVNRKDTNQAMSSSTSLLLSHNPHELVRPLERVMQDEASAIRLDQLPSPRLFYTHIPYTSLPESITTFACKIVYISRNPLDTLVSQWHFYPRVISKIIGEDFQPPCVEDYFEEYIQGRIPYGPFFEHVVEYWNKSLERPDKVLFLKYEDLKEDPVVYIKRLADFVGFPFSSEEENEGVIRGIIEMCSIKNMKELDVNKIGTIGNFYDKKNFFRKGEVGDWTNYFTPTMVTRMNKLIEEKFSGTGLSFKLLPS